MARTLSTAEERTVAVIDAAVHAFASTGYHATPVSRVAAEAGISPAYVFRLFPTKQQLFLAALHECFDRILAALRHGLDDVAEDAAPTERLRAMALRYAGLIGDRDLLMLQVNALAAGDDETIRTALRAEHARLVEFVTERSGAGQADVQEFFARGQLCHLVTVLDLAEDPSPWAQQLSTGIRHPARRAGS